MARAVALALLSLPAVIDARLGTPPVMLVDSDDNTTELPPALAGPFVLHKRYALSHAPQAEWDIVVIPDEHLTHSCANYIDDGTTVFSRDEGLVLRVASECDGGVCMNSGRVMSKQSFKYGIFTFSARVPKCNYIWPAIWLLPNNTHGEGNYGRWPCSGEVDVLETVHDSNFGAFNIVQGYGSDTENGCMGMADVQTVCNGCVPTYCLSSTYSPGRESDRYFVEETDCNATHPSWDNHLFVLNWQPGELTTWIDPELRYDAAGRLVEVIPKPPSEDDEEGMPTWVTYRRETTPKWQAVQPFFEQCFNETAAPDAPFDDRFKIVLNIAVGGYGGAPCVWGEDTCHTVCGGAVGSELILHDISVWELAM